MRTMLAVTLFALSAGFQLKMIFLFRRMMREVNARLAPDAGIPEIGPSWLRGRVIKLHRRHFPASNMRKQLYISWALTMAAFLSALALVVRFG